MYLGNNVRLLHPPYLTKYLTSEILQSRECLGIDIGEFSLIKGTEKLQEVCLLFS